MRVVHGQATSKSKLKHKNRTAGITVGSERPAHREGHIGETQVIRLVNDKTTAALQASLLIFNVQSKMKDISGQNSGH